MNRTISVIVIVFNDAARLPVAVESVLRQTLPAVDVIIVDDASTDSTAEVAARLAARHPDRVRVVGLPANSGGCSRPRNAGIDAATGRYVMFLDSDDELPRTACARLVEAADREQADFAAGLCHRVHLGRGGEITPWYRRLYAREATYTSILENPGLLYDTLSTNKCYRRSFLDEHRLRFPEGLHYEDLLFSGEVYLHARRFTLIPHVVYRWKVAEDPQTPSITNQRSELRNFEDRLRVHRLLDEEFAAHGRTELKLHKDVKFLRHDLLLYLRDLPWRDPGYRSAFLQLAAGYLSTLDARAFAQVHPVQAIATTMILRQDEKNLFSAIDFVAHGERLSTPLAGREGRIYWTGEHLDDPQLRAVLDVTELGFHDRPLEQLKPAGRATSLELTPGRLRLSGDVVNPLGRIQPDADVAAELVLAVRGSSSRSVTVPMPRPRHDGDVLRWQCDVDLSGALRGAVGTRTWDVRVRLRVDDRTLTAPVAAADPAWDGRSVDVDGGAGRLLRQQVRVFVTPIGDLALQVLPGRAAAASLGRLSQRMVHSPRTRPLRTAWRRTRAAARGRHRSRLREELFARALPRVLPASRRPLVVFESSRGRRCGGDPRAVYDEIVRRGLAVDVAWAFRGSSGGFPPTRLVKHGSLRYFATLARAWAWVEDEGVPLEAVKRAHGVYVQTGHGTPVRWAGYDDEKVRRAAKDVRIALQRRVHKWDVLVTRSPFEEEVLAQAFRPTAMPLRAGSPRNDRLVRPVPDDEKALRARLHLGADEVVLWVPSCDEAVIRPGDEAVGPRQRLLVWRPQPGLEPRRAGVDVSDLDLSELLAIADVLVTDHHPALLDYPLRRRPVVLVGCRCGVHAGAGARAKAYLDLDAEGPGPVVWDVPSLTGELADLDALCRRTVTRLDEAAARFGAHDDGDAAARVVDELTRRWAAASPAGPWHDTP